MEASSPLAAMQPSTFHIPQWGRNEMFTSHPHSHMPTGFGPGSFNFRDLSMDRPANQDYFSLKQPVRGSSPTASLAADLSQNFHIDMSPQLPTPRRALFTSNLFGTIDGRESVTTPPLPSSSPGPLNEMMDMSPLPHKQPYFAQIEIRSPTPGQEGDDLMQSSPPRAADPEGPRPVERRRSSLLRPCLTRTKGFSTSSVPQAPTSQIPTFTFGAGGSKLSTSTSMSLGECFMESPPQARRPQSANSPSAPILGPRPSKPFSSISSNSIRNGSPISGHVRRPSNPLVRPRKQFRRSLSMFEHPGDVMGSTKVETQHSTLHTVMDVDEHQPALPHFFQEGRPDSIPRIAKQTLLDVLDGRYAGDFVSHMIIDCRFEYEFDGGHINGAVNYNDKEMLSTQLFSATPLGKTLLIFHCEYSAHRAPLMARHVRKQDRTANAEQYPRLTFPDIYILEGGYSSFFAGHRERCFPQSYVEMGAKEHAYTCEREMGRLRQNRAKFSRAQTFAFGQHQLDDSPTAPTRSKTTESDLPMLDVSMSPVAFNRGGPKRLVSY